MGIIRGFLLWFALGVLLPLVLLEGVASLLFAVREVATYVPDRPPPDTFHARHDA